MQVDNSRWPSGEELRAMFTLQPDGRILRTSTGALVPMQPMPNGYARVKIGRRYAMAHRLVVALVIGKWPDGHVDHKNGDKLDNRIENLRIVTPGQNSQNVDLPTRRNALGIRGVSPFKGRYRATIQVKGKYHSLGVFDTPDEAHRAYVEAKRRLHPYWVEAA